MKKILLAFIATGFATACYAVTNISGNFTVGAGQTYTTLTNDSATGFFKFLNSIDGTTSVISGPITVTIVSDITIETGVVALHALHYDGSGPYTVTIQPDAANLRTISGGPSVSGTGFFAFNGAGYVTIDGRFNGAGKYLKFSSSTFYLVNTILGFINGANHITVKNSILEGSATGDNIGSINILGSTGPDGNNNLTFDNNDIGNTSYISTRVYCNGSANYPNHDIAFTNNTIFNFLDGGYLNDYGINITATGNGSNFTITGNSFYQTTNGSYGAYHISAITLLAGSSSTGNVISNNYIGGNQPLCAGANWNQTNNNSGPQVSNLVDINCGSVTVSNNVIKNIRIHGSNHSFVLLNIAGTTAATISNNQFGDNNANLRVSMEQYDTDTYLKGIDNTSTGTVVADQNQFLNLWTFGTGLNTIYSYVEAIRFTGASANSQVTNNTVSTCAATGGDYSFTDNNFGININSSSGAMSNLLISGNSIQIPYSSSSGVHYNMGILVQASGSFSGTISNNRIYDQQAMAFCQVYGIYMDMTGSGAHNCMVANNQVTLANAGGSGNVRLYGIAEGGCNGSGSATNYFYNSVYIAGTNSSTASNSYCFYSNPCSGSAAGPTLTIKNNIFVNARTGTGIHYSIAKNNSVAGWSAGASDYNLLVSRGSLGNWQAGSALSFSQWQTNAACDLNSVSAAWSGTTSSFAGAPYPGTNTLSTSALFTATATGDLHIKTTDAVSYQFVSNLGTDLTSGGITTDYDGNIRCPNTGCAGGASLPDIGSDEINTLTTGIEPIYEPALLLYPNPAANQITIHAAEWATNGVNPSTLHNKGNIYILIVNVLGQQTSPPTPLPRRGEDAVIDISKLAAGVYFLHLKTERSTVVKKFIKE